MNHFRFLGTGVLVACFAAGPVWAQDDAGAGAAGAEAAETLIEEAVSLDEVVRLIEEGRSADTEAHLRRVDEFRASLAEQTQLLEQARADKATQERISEQLDTEFDQNELLIIDVTEQYNERLGSLRELFGVLEQYAGDARSSFQQSTTNVEFPDREAWLSEFAEKMGETGQLPSIDEIETLWFELAREATELGKVKLLRNHRIVTADGVEVTQDIVRIGGFNLAADGRYLEHVIDTNSVRELQRQPSEARFLDSTSELINAAPGGPLVRFGIDVTRGQLLSLLIQNPDQMEQIRQGGTPGYIIIALGILGVLLSLERLITLGIAGRKVSSQLKSDTPRKNNPLGRVLLVYEENKNVDTETLELKLGEAILKEQPALQRSILFIKIISVVAPLLGLLGTVVGMINTFQAIMLFGAGDATRMAGGISQALQTTKLGLIVAIPMVLLHTIVSGRSRRIVQVLQEQSSGIVARQAEKAS